MSNDAAFERVSSIIGGAMDDAWKKIMRDLAAAARGEKVISAVDLGAGRTVSMDDLRGFFAVAGGANLAIDFPCLLKRHQVGLFRAAVIEHGIAPIAWGDANAKMISGEISIGIGIRF